MKTFTDSQWDEIHKIICLLANDQPYKFSWCGWSKESGNHVTCYICNQDIDVAMFDVNGRVNHLRNHGYQHLVDRKLIPFL